MPSPRGESACASMSTRAAVIPSTMLHTTEREPVLAILAEMKPDWHLRSIGAIERLPGGYANDNFSFDYAGSGYVLRVVREGLPGAIARELERDLLATSLASLAPTLVAYRLPQGHLLTRRIDAPLLADVPSNVADLAEYLIALHRRLPRIAHRYDVGALVRRWIALAAANVDEATVSRRLAVLDRLPAIEAPVACHNDLNPWNVIACGEPESWRTLDWEWFGGNSRWFDAICLARGLGLADAAETELIARFADALGSRPPTADVRRADTLCYHLREWAWAHAACARWGARPELQGQIERSEDALSELEA